MIVIEIILIVFMIMLAVCVWLFSQQIDILSSCLQEELKTLEKIEKILKFLNRREK